MEVPIEEVFGELLKRAEAGQLPSKQAGMLRNLSDRMAKGKPLSEIQEELLRDLAAEHGVC